jgi:hypothetical protein
VTTTVDCSITKFQINQDSVGVWKLLNRYILQWVGVGGEEENNILINAL